MVAVEFIPTRQDVAIAALSRANALDKYAQEQFQIARECKAKRLAESSVRFNSKAIAAEDEAIALRAFVRQIVDALDFVELSRIS